MASSLQIGLKWLPLIFSRQLKVSSLTVKNPDILLVKNRAGKWNFSSLGNSASKSNTKPPASSTSAAELSVDKVEIQNGKLRFAQTNGRALGQQHAYE